MCKKLFIEDSVDPWITWDKDLYKQQERDRGMIECQINFFDIELTPNPWEADVFFINRNTVNIKDELFVGKEVFMFLDAIPPNTQEELRIIKDVTYANDNGWTCVTESLSTYEKFLSAGLKNDPWLWRRPSRISYDMMLDECPIADREQKIIAVFNAGHPLSKAADLVKAYLGAFIILRDDHEIEPSLQIFSHTDLPFEPFNDIKFEGFAHNRKVFAAVKKAQLFIWPTEVETYPNPLQEAAQLGVPGLQYVSDGANLKQHIVFPDAPWTQYKNVEELTQKIVDHFVGIKNIKNYFNDKIIETKGATAEESMEFGLEMFNAEIMRRINETV